MLYVIVHRGDQDVPAVYDGMSVGAISTSLAAMGFTGTVVSKEDYDAFVASLVR